MNSTATSSQTRSISRAFPTSLSVAIQIAILILVGFTATWLHARFRFPLNLPGRHGLEFMLLIMGARYASTIRLSATIAVSGSIIASLIPVLGFKDPMIPYIYLGIGALIDFAWYQWPNVKKWIPLAALLGGLAYSLIPIIRIILSVLSTYQENSLRHGFIIPILTHIGFGFVGAFAGVGIVYEVKKRLKKSKR